MDDGTHRSTSTPIETRCIDCGETITVDPLTADPETARCPDCAYEAAHPISPELAQLAADEVGRGILAALDAKAAALASDTTFSETPI